MPSCFLFNLTSSVCMSQSSFLTSSYVFMAEAIPCVQKPRTSPSVWQLERRVCGWQVKGKHWSCSVWLSSKPLWVWMQCCSLCHFLHPLMAEPESHLSSFLEEKIYFKSEIVFLLWTDNVELILRTVSNQHSIESQDNDQPDYDSVASDEDTDVETRASKASRQKVRGHTSHGQDRRASLKTCSCPGAVAEWWSARQIYTRPEFSSQHHQEKHTYTWQKK